MQEIDEDFSRTGGQCVCGSGDFSRVRVLQKSGDFYVTEFVACSSCGVMYHRPARADRPSTEMTPERRAFLKRTGWLK